jgi:hypothetical protein
VAKDVCDVLGLENPSMSLKALDDDELAKVNLGRQGETNIISESGLYAIALRCRDAMTPGSVPHRFRKWVTAEVLQPGLFLTPIARIESPKKFFRGGVENTLRQKTAPYL